MKKFLTGLFLAAVASSPALSADLAYKAAPYSPVPMAHNWSGWYAGIGVGYAAGTLQSPQLANFGVNSEPETWFFSVQGGVREQVAGNFVLGAQLSIPIAGETHSAGSPFLPANQFATVRTGFTIIPTVQFGYALGRWLPFVGFGVGVSDQRITTYNLPGLLNQTVNRWAVFSTATLGVDYAITPNWIAGIRYHHTFAPLRNYVFATGGVPAVLQAGLSADGVSGVLNYQFH